MNILHITRAFSPLVEGVGQYIYELSRRLIERGDACRVLMPDRSTCMPSRRFSRRETIGGIEVHRIPAWGNRRKTIPLFVPLGVFRWADVVHMHDVRFFFETALVLKKMLKFKLVWSTHGFIFATPRFRSVKRYLVSAYYIPALSFFVDRVICVGKGDYRFFRDALGSKAVLIENGIDICRFGSIRPQFNRGELCYFGRVDEYKGVDLLLKTLAFFKDNGTWRLSVFGASYHERLEGETKRLSRVLGIEDRIHWHGYQRPDCLSRMLSRGHLYFFPSQYEGFGRTLIEAMASGCVCVANDIPAYRHIITDKENGFIVDFSYPEECARKIRAILAAPVHELERISSNAKELARRYAWSGKVDMIAEEYRRCG